MAISSKHRVLDTPAIKYILLPGACSLFPVWGRRRFEDKQSSAAFTEHSFSTCRLCRAFCRLTWVQRCRMSRVSVMRVADASIGR